jgi:hypothetical protein
MVALAARLLALSSTWALASAQYRAVRPCTLPPLQEQHTSKTWPGCLTHKAPGHEDLCVVDWQLCEPVPDCEASKIKWSQGSAWCFSECTQASAQSTLSTTVLPSACTRAHHTRARHSHDVRSCPPAHGALCTLQIEYAAGEPVCMRYESSNHRPCHVVYDDHLPLCLEDHCGDPVADCANTAWCGGAASSEVYCFDACLAAAAAAGGSGKIEWAEGVPYCSAADMTTPCRDAQQSVAGATAPYCEMATPPPWMGTLGPTGPAWTPGPTDPVSEPTPEPAYCVDISGTVEVNIFPSNENEMMGPAHPEHDLDGDGQTDLAFVAGVGPWAGIATLQLKNGASVAQVEDTWYQQGRLRAEGRACLQSPAITVLQADLEPSKFSTVAPAIDDDTQQAVWVVRTSADATFVVRVVDQTVGAGIWAQFVVESKQVRIGPCNTRACILSAWHWQKCDSAVVQCLPRHAKAISLARMW